MKRHNLTAGFVLAGLIVLGIANPAAAGKPAVFKGILAGEFTTTGAPPILTLDGRGAGLGTPLGLFTYEFPHTVNFGTTPPSGQGTYTFRALNGDTVLAEFVGFSRPIVPGFVFVTEAATITGGTGRFAGASGEFTIMRVVDQMNGETIGWFDGTISRERRN